MLNQFRYFHYAETVSEQFQNKIPDLYSLLKNPIPGKRTDQMFWHELAHSMELVDRGSSFRLKINNFGWPIGVIDHTARTMDTECKVFAIQYLLEEYGDGSRHPGILEIETADLLFRFEFRCRSCVKQAYIEKSAKIRIEEYMDQYRSRLVPLLSTTTEYIVDNCIELM